MLNRVTELVRDDVTVFAIVHATGTEVHRVIARGVEGLVVAVPVSVCEGGKVANTVRRSGVVIKAQRVHVTLDCVDGVVDVAAMRPLDSWLRRIDE